MPVVFDIVGHDNQSSPKVLNGTVHLRRPLGILVDSLLPLVAGLLDSSCGCTSFDVCWRWPRGWRASGDIGASADFEEVFSNSLLFDRICPTPPHFLINVRRPSGSITLTDPQTSIRPTTLTSSIRLRWRVIIIINNFLDGLVWIINRGRGNNIKLIICSANSKGYVLHTVRTNHL